MMSYKDHIKTSIAPFGIELHPMTRAQLISVVNRTISANARLIICSSNLHAIYVYHHDKIMKELQDMAIKRIDGMPLILLSKLSGFTKVRSEHRLTWIDLFWPLIESISYNSYRLFILGATPEVSEKGKKTILKRYPDLALEVYNGYFQMEGHENDKVVAAINSFKPDILIVGMGMPRQEHWIHANQANLSVNVIATAGAILEYITGYVSTPPRVLGSLGLEWLYRLVEKPSRFWKRYLVEPWFIFFLLVKRVTTKKTDI